MWMWTIGMGWDGMEFRTSEAMIGNLSKREGHRPNKMARSLGLPFHTTISETKKDLSGF